MSAPGAARCSPLPQGEFVVHKCCNCRGYRVQGPVYRVSGLKWALPLTSHMTSTMPNRVKLPISLKEEACGGRSKKSTARQVGACLHVHT